MKKNIREKKFCYIFNIFAALMFAVLFYYCLGLTGVNRADLGDEYIYFKMESVILSIVKICLALACLWVIAKPSDRFQSIKSRNMLVGIVCILSAVISFGWIFSCKTVPQADQLLICNYANDFNQGDFSALQKGGYVALCPQQLGMITFLRLIYAVFGAGNYMAFRCLAAASVPLFVFSGCKIVRILSNNNMRAEFYYLLFILFCFPMYAYTSFVYGDLISTAISMFGVWMFLSCLKCFNWKKTVLFGVSIGIAVQLRQNQFILVIALVIVLLVKMLSHRCREYFIVAAALLLGVLVMHSAVWCIYHDVRPDDAAAIPASLYVSMGLNDDSGHAGWYNSYGSNTFEELNYDLQSANVKAYNDLKIYFDLFVNDPHKMLDFFVRKMNAQWNAPMYQCIIMNAKIVEAQPALIDNIFHHGKAGILIEFGMKIYQLLMYGSILFLLTAKRKNFVEIEKYVLLIAVYGGFLFSLMWEAKTRYILPYLFMQIPYMAIGVDEVLVSLEARFLKHKHFV